MVNSIFHLVLLLLIAFHCYIVQINIIFSIVWNLVFVFDILNKTQLPFFVLHFSHSHYHKYFFIIKIQRVYLFPENPSMLCSSIGDTIRREHIYFENENSTVCLESTTFHWFNSTDQVAISQVKFFYEVNKIKAWA